MLNSERGALTGALDGLAGAYGAELDEVALENYWLALRHLEVATVREAIDRVRVQGRKFLPHPGELRAVADSLVRSYFDLPEWHPSEDPVAARERARREFEASTPEQIAEGFIAEAEKAASRERNAMLQVERYDPGDPLRRDSEYERRVSHAEQAAFRESARWWREQTVVVPRLRP